MSVNDSCLRELVSRTGIDDWETFFLFAACIVGCSEADGEPPMLVDMGHGEFDVTLVSSGEFGLMAGSSLMPDTRRWR